MTANKPTLDYATPPPPPQREPFRAADLLRLVWAGLFLALVMFLLRFFVVIFTRS